MKKTGKRHYYSLVWAFSHKCHKTAATIFHSRPKIRNGNSSICILMAVPPEHSGTQTQAGSLFTLPLDSSPILLYFQFFENYRRNGSLALYESSEFLYRFLAQLLRELETPRLNESHLIVQAMQYIRQHFATLESISQIADACNISHEHLTRCFRKETGQTPLQYLTKLRIEHALSLLLNTSDSIEQIAMNCGFQNGNYFAKVFRKYMQCTPEEYRRRNG